jgi:Secretion system C-terminal sorting domain
LSFIEGAGTSRYGIYGNYQLPIPWPSLIDLKISDSTCEMLTSTFHIKDSGSANIFPNPFEKFININPVNERAKYEIIDVTGNVLLADEVYDSTMINTEYLMPGVYFVRINGKSIKMIKI